MHKYHAKPVEVDGIRFRIDRRLSSIRELQRYRKKIANDRLIVEEAGIWANLIATQVSWTDIKRLCKSILIGGHKIKVEAEAHRPGRRYDQDNINAGFNKLVVDSLKRKDCIPDDSIGIIDVSDVVQIVEKIIPYCIIRVCKSKQNCTNEAQEWAKKKR